ncbi:hypothetical protein BA20089_00020 [Bifidobacterium asteroides DSM 20089]|uniref:Uncharacterized protein n=1 Tax=Bifidobacterium asteroides DSM 20089 TaxID=1437594 RepID=A0AAD0A9P4_9BIFI|nr:hypothetical protein [Bifidobacterium asteroides]ATO40750.1 hypothetical protein BA20089_00020 [Bifidobacterium asteroides DSM 20089]
MLPALLVKSFSVFCVLVIAADASLSFLAVCVLAFCVLSSVPCAALVLSGMPFSVAVSSAMPPRYVADGALRLVEIGQNVGRGGIGFGVDVVVVWLMVLETTFLPWRQRFR